MRPESRLRRWGPACWRRAPPASRAPGKPGAGSPPRSGGTLRAAFVGGGASETLDFFKRPSALDLVRARAWHSTLGNLDPEGPDGVRYGVLKGIDVSDDLSAYTLHVRPGVRFTDGSELTSADILHSLGALAARSTLPVYPDSTARAGALTSGETDVAHDLSPITARTLADDGKVRLVPTKSPYLVGLSFQMNMNTEPFADPRVREAFKRAADREAMVKTVFYGNAEIGNDLPSMGFPDYAEGLPPARPRPGAGPQAP